MTESAPAKIEIQNTSRDSDRVNSLTQALQEVDRHSPGTFPLHLLRECVLLWRDVLDTGQRFAVGQNRSREGIALAESQNLTSHMDQDEINQTITLLVSGNLSDDDEVRKIVDQSLTTLNMELRAAVFTPSSAGPPAVFDSSGAVLDTREVATVWLSRAKNLDESSRGLRRLAHLEERTREALATIRDAENDLQVSADKLGTMREQLVEARAERAQHELAAQFKKLSRNERATCWAFRVLTFILLGVAVAVAWSATSEAGDWADVVGHVAVVVAVGSAATYTARLASTHGATADWAKAVQVQLLTFQDFLEVIEEPEVKHRVYEEFGRRVLGPPPGKGEEGAPLPTAQLLELANVIAAARKP